MEEMKGSDDGEIANGPVEEESNDVLEVESEYDSGEDLREPFLSCGTGRTF